MLYGSPNLNPLTTHIKSQMVRPIATSNNFFFNMPGTIWNNIQCSLVKNIGEIVYHNPSQAHVNESR